MTIRLAPNSIVRSDVTRRRYRIKDWFGTGGFGTAYRATPIGETRGGDVCIKVTRNPASWHRECYFGELLRDNPRVIQVQDSFPHLAGHRVNYMLALELAEYGDLQKHLSKLPKPWGEKRVRREVARILRALDQIHGGGAMHRDITPFNLRLQR